MKVKTNLHWISALGGPVFNSEDMSSFELLYLKVNAYLKAYFETKKLNISDDDCFAFLFACTSNDEQIINGDTIENIEKAKDVISKLPKVPIDLTNVSIDNVSKYFADQLKVLLLGNKEETR